MKVFLFFPLAVGLMVACLFSNREPSKNNKIAQDSTEIVASKAIPAVEPTPVEEKQIEKTPEPIVQRKEEVQETHEEVANQKKEPLLEFVEIEKKQEAPKEVVQQTQEVAKEEPEELQKEIAENEETQESPQELILVEIICEKPALQESDLSEAELVEDEEYFYDSEVAEEQNIVQEAAVQAIREVAIDETMQSEPQKVCCPEGCEPISCEKRWYFSAKPGYYYFTDEMMRQFFDNGGFTFRGEFGYRFWKPFIVWVDGGYFQKSGHALGGTESVELKLATITLGLKLICYFNDYVAAYAGAGPRLFMMMMKNDSPFVRSEDNAFGIGAGFNGGFWFFPIPCWNNLFLDLFADYSWKELKIDEDEISSTDFNVDVSGLSVGLGLGIRF